MADSHVSEVWAKVQGFPAYSVSSAGRVRRDGASRGAVPGRVLKLSRDANGYACVNLYDNGRPVKSYVHRLVAAAFLGAPPSPDHHVAHWDGDGMNASCRNLRWVTQSENEADKVRHGRAIYTPKGSRTVSPEQLRKAQKAVRDGNSVRSTAINLGLSHDALSLALKHGLAPSKYRRTGIA